MSYSSKGPGHFWTGIHHDDPYNINGEDNKQTEGLNAILNGLETNKDQIIFIEPVVNPEVKLPDNEKITREQLCQILDSIDANVQLSLNVALSTEKSGIRMLVVTRSDNTWKVNDNTPDTRFTDSSRDLQIALNAIIESMMPGNATTAAPKASSQPSKPSVAPTTSTPSGAPTSKQLESQPPDLRTSVLATLASGLFKIMRANRAVNQETTQRRNKP